MRRARYEGSWYPHGERLRSQLEEFFSKTSDLRDAKAIIAPHAGYIYSGQTAAFAHSRLVDAETYVIIANAHIYASLDISTRGSFKNSLGEVRVDENFARAILSETSSLTEGDSVYGEHSFELQLPFLQYLHARFMIVPMIANSSYVDADIAKEIGGAIANAEKRTQKRVGVVATTDMTHYGVSYGYVPFSGSDDVVIKGIYKVDGEMLECIKNMDTKGLLEVSTGKTACGIGAVCITMEYAKAIGCRKGELLRYSTSYDVTQDASSVVGYAAVAFVE